MNNITLSRSQVNGINLALPDESDQASTGNLRITPVRQALYKSDAVRHVRGGFYGDIKAYQLSIQLWPDCQRMTRPCKQGLPLGHYPIHGAI